MTDQLKVTFTHIDKAGNEVEIGFTNFEMNSIKSDEIDLEKEVKIATHHIEEHLRKIGLI